MSKHDPDRYSRDAFTFDDVDFGSDESLLIEIEVELIDVNGIDEVYGWSIAKVEPLVGDATPEMIAFAEKHAKDNEEKIFENYLV